MVCLDFLVPCTEHALSTVRARALLNPMEGGACFFRGGLFERGVYDKDVNDSLSIILPRMLLPELKYNFTNQIHTFATAVIPSHRSVRGGGPATPTPQFQKNYRK